jgi:hypothetical protein
MEDKIAVYGIKKSNMFGGLFVLALLFFGVTLPSIISGDSISQLIEQQGPLWLLGIVLTLVPLGGRFEVGNDYVKAYFFGIGVDTLRASDIETIKYGRVKRWGVVGMGNDLMGSVKTKHGHRYFSFSEAGYGKEAIMHAKRALETK